MVLISTTLLSIDADNRRQWFIPPRPIGLDVMAAKLKIGVLVVLVVAASAAFAASANTTGGVDRDSNVNVVSDDVGLLSIQDGTTGGLVYQNSSGALNIDFTKGGANGVNTAANFSIGDTSSANTSYAFNVTNQDTTNHDITFDYSGSDSLDGDDNIQFRVYDSTGSSLGTASEEGSFTTTSEVTPGETVYVVLVVDTYGLDTSADLSGTLSITI